MPRTRARRDLEYVGIPDARSATDEAEPDLPPAHLFARRLLVRDGYPADSEQRAVIDALQGTCARVCSNLRDTMGDDGCTALLARALARTEGGHPSLGSIRRISRGKIAIDNVAGGVESHGVAPVTAGVEALLAALIEILGKLIGEDMAIRVMELGTPRGGRGENASSP